MQTNKYSSHKGLRLFLKSMTWTLIALSLVALGYFGAGFLFGR